MCRIVSLYSYQESALQSESHRLEVRFHVMLALHYISEPGRKVLNSH